MDKPASVTGPPSMAPLGRLGLVCGLAALAIIAAHLHLSGGFGIAPPFEEMPVGPADYLPALVVTLLFQYLTPLLCTVAILTGLAALRFWTGRVALVAGLLAFFDYLAFLRGCVDTIAAAG